MSDKPIQRVPENAPGDFYVAKNLCLQCCLPHTEAPDLLNDPKQEFRECYFRRQPTTPQEIERAIKAIRISCTGALWYDGKDPAIISKLPARTCHPPPESENLSLLKRAIRYLTVRWG